MGLFSGQRPSSLGLREGRFKPCPWKPNCVCSTGDPGDASHFIAPLAFNGAAVAAWQRLAALIKSRERVTIVTEDADYLHAEFNSRSLGYVDDVEFALDAKAGLIQVRSASRLGVRDFGVNRARVESIRAAFAPGSAPGSIPHG